MSPAHEEWLRQAEYDLETAAWLVEGNRGLHAAFMCHLALEKALKGVYHSRVGQVPPKSHNLFYSVDVLKLSPPENVARTLAQLQEAGIVTRYPEDLATMRSVYTKTKVSRPCGNKRSILMDKAAVLDIVEDFRIAIERQGVSIQRIILFGSHVRGEGSEGSDIDLIVISPDFRNMAYWDRIDRLCEAVLQVRKPIDAVAKTPEEWEEGNSLLLHFARTGEVVYEQ